MCPVFNSDWHLNCDYFPNLTNTKISRAMLVNRFAHRHDAVADSTAASERAAGFGGFVPLCGGVPCILIRVTTPPPSRLRSVIHCPLTSQRGMSRSFIQVWNEIHLGERVQRRNTGCSANIWHKILKRAATIWCAVLQTGMGTGVSRSFIQVWNEMHLPVRQPPAKDQKW